MEVGSRETTFSFRMALVLTEARQVAGDAEWGKDASRRRRLNVEIPGISGKGFG